MIESIEPLLAACIAAPLWVGVIYLYIVKPTRRRKPERTSR